MKFQTIYLILRSIFMLILIKIKTTHGLSCKDESGEDVDWFIVYKFPKNLEKGPTERAKKGFGYAYITDKTVDSGDWTVSTKEVTQKNCIFAKTFEQFFSKDKDMSYVFYSDQPPGGTASSTTAHAKGMFGSDKGGAFWLSHSVPNFPAFNGKTYKFPSTGNRNGQTAICITVGTKKESLDNIANHILIIKPHIYKKKISKKLISASNSWEDVENEEWNKEDHNHVTLKSKAGVSFETYSKNGKFQSDIYAELIAKSIKKDMLVQSWRNGAGGKLDSDCDDKYKVNNVNRINVIKGGWDYTSDHSKWGITSDGKQSPLTCIADINRMKSQFKRGGGSVCSNSAKVWKIFKKSIESIEGCDVRRRSPDSVGNKIKTFSSLSNYSDSVVFITGKTANESVTESYTITSKLPKKKLIVRNLTTSKILTTQMATTDTITVTTEGPEAPTCGLTQILTTEVPEAPEVITTTSNLPKQQRIVKKLTTSKILITKMTKTDTTEVETTSETITET